MAKIGVFVGRMCPIHVGHMETIRVMTEECGEDHSLIILGSMAQKLTFRVMFSYHQRRNWIRKIYGDTYRIVGVPDFPGDNALWVSAIDDLVDSTFRHLDDTTDAWVPKEDVTFYGGSVRDLEYFSDYGRLTRVVDRSSIPVSATVIRDLLLRSCSVSGLVDARIENDVVNKFHRAIEESEKWSTPF